MLTASVENMLVTSIDTTLETGVVPTQYIVIISTVHRQSEVDIQCWIDVGPIVNFCLGRVWSHIPGVFRLLLSLNGLIVFGRVLHWWFHPVLAAHNTAHPSDPTKYLRAMDIRLCRWFGWLAGFHIWFFALGVVLMDPFFITSNNPMRKWLLFVAFQQHSGHAKLPFNVSRLEFMWNPISLLFNVSGCF